MNNKIDVHLHIIPSFFSEAVYAAGSGPAIGRFPEWNPELALEIMDKHGIEVAMTSVAQPGVQFAPVAQARTLARRCNEYAAELNARYPDRFGAFALVPMQTPDMAIEELRHSFESLQFEGACLFASYGERFLGDAIFDPVMAYLDAQKAVVFIHPALHPSSRTLTLPWPGFMIEYTFDTTRAATNLLFSGALVRYPNIQFILPHAGGVLPYLAWRLSVAPMIDSRLPRFTREDIFKGLGRFWYDNALAPGDMTMGTLAHVASPDRIVFGSDWPFANDRVMTEELKSFDAPGFLSEQQKLQIERQNALRLLPRRAKA